MFVRAYKNFGGSTDVENAGTAEIHFNDGRVVQISCGEDTDPRGDGMILLRIWPAKGTSEYGGGNLEDVSMTFFVTDEETVIDSLRFSKFSQKLTRESAGQQNGSE